MPERYFITEEILYDMVMSERQEHAIALQILELAREGGIRLCVCALTIDTALQALSEYMGNVEARAFLRAALEGFEVLPLTEAVSMRALSLEDTRFSDAATIICAETERVDGIIVHDPAGFSAADIKIIPIASLQ